MPGDDHELRVFQRAARRYALSVAPDSRPDAVFVRDVNRRVIVALALPARDDDPTAAAPARPPPGWDFAGPAPRYDGDPLPISGRKLDVLKALAAHDGPVPPDRLRDSWGGYPVEETTIRWTIGELRKALKAHFPGFEGDPITSDGHGYALVIR